VTAVLVGVGALLLAAAVPGPWRGTARAVLLWATALLPVFALAWWMTTWEGKGPARWLLLVPAAFFWLAFLDLRCGLTGRIARPPARGVPRLRETNGDDAA
jgi:hypothetical protein